MPSQAVLSVTDVAKGQILAFNEKNWERIRSSLAPGIVYEEIPTGVKVQGIDQVLPAWRMWANALPDAKARFLNEYVSGNTVVLELEWNGTHNGPLRTPKGEIAPTGKKVSLRACQIVETSDEKASAIRHYFDMATLLKQLGVS